MGIITRSGLTFSNMMGPNDEMETKDIKMTRKESSAGRKQYRYVKEVPLVAEDIMNSPIMSTSAEVESSGCGQDPGGQAHMRNAGAGERQHSGLLLLRRDSRRDREMVNYADKGHNDRAGDH